MGNRIKELRKEKKITQAQLSAYLNIDQTTVSKWELEKAFPDSKVLSVLADYFDVSIDYLLNRTSFYYPRMKEAQLPNDENKILSTYRNLTYPWKMRVQAYIDVAKEMCDEENHKK